MTTYLAFVLSLAVLAYEVRHMGWLRTFFGVVGVVAMRGLRWCGVETRPGPNLSLAWRELEADEALHAVDPRFAAELGYSPWGRHGPWGPPGTVVEVPDGYELLASPPYSQAELDASWDTVRAMGWLTGEPIEGVDA